MQYLLVGILCRCRSQLFTTLRPLSIIVTGEGSQKCLLAVNAGSDSVSSFQIKSASDIELVEAYNTTAIFPVSIAERKGLVYVLGVNGTGSIDGFTLLPFTCQLFPLESATIELDQALPPAEFDDPPAFTASPAQIGFTPEDNLLVTIKQNGGGNVNLTNQAGSLNIYEINGTLTPTDLVQATVTDASGDGTVPFSFTFDDDGNLLLVEAFGAADGAQVDVIVDVDNLGYRGGLISEADSGSLASCWIVYNPKTSCVYTTNNAGNSISSFYLSESKEVTLVSNETALLNAPLDMVLSPDFQYLYALSTGHTDGTKQV